MGGGRRMYSCKIFMHTPGLSRENIIAILEKKFGRAQKESLSCFKFKAFDILISKNGEYDPNKLRTYPDGFLFYEMTADVEIFEDHVTTMNDISEVLWDNGIPAVISCDDEDELNEYIFGL